MPDLRSLFTEGDGYSVFDTILDNVILLHRKDPKLSAWTGGRIFKSASAEPIQDLGVPQIVFAFRSSEPDERIGSCTFEVVTIAHVVMWSQPVRHEEVGDPTIISYVEHHKGLVLSNLRSESPVHRILPVNITAMAPSFGLSTVEAVPVDADSELIFAVAEMRLPVKLNQRTRSPR